MTLTIAQLALLFGIGLVAGFLNVMAGGGSMITMPVLVFMGFSGPLANGTNRIAILVQNLAASGGYYRQKAAEPKLSLTLSLCAIPGAVIGAYFGTKLEGALFNYVLAGVMIFVLIYMIFSQRQKKRLEKTSDSPTDNLSAPANLTRAQNLAGHLLMFGVGLYGGFIQAGVGILIMACLGSAMGMTLVRANIHKVFIIGFYTLVALTIFGIHGHVYWTAGICLACGNAIGALVATRVNLRGGDRVVRIILYLVILAMAAKLIYVNW
ncbi:MAG: sulfite exporter TauE/SafE family protein [Planctomycetia bacterium]|jgi:uncharacterized membrane protein YfcA